MITNYDNRFHQSIPNLLQCVADGNKYLAQRLLRDNFRLLLDNGPVSDHARSFVMTTPFKCALWSLDSDMCRMMLDSIPKNSEGIEMKRTLLNQAEELKREGLIYTIKDKTICEPTLNLDPLIGAYKHYQRIFSAPDDESLFERAEEASKYWCQQVGGYQSCLPSHYLTDHYGDNPLDLTRLCKVKHKESIISIFPLEEGRGLGSEFALYYSPEGRNKRTDSGGMGYLLTNEEIIQLNRFDSLKREEIESILERLTNEVSSEMTLSSVP